MPKPLTVLGIETSCDETAAAVVARGADGRGRILSNVVRAQYAGYIAENGVNPRSRSAKLRVAEKRG